MGQGWRSSWRYERRWPRYVTVAETRAKAERRLARLVKKGEKLDPVVVLGRTIAETFWGRAWCDHIENHCDFWNRLGRGRAYVRNGMVCDLVIEPGRVMARVMGNDLYRVEIRIKKLPPARWKAIRRASTGNIASVVDLLQGRLSEGVMRVMTDPAKGLFPRYNEIELSCSCPDWAVMCKHVAAALYGVGARLDDRPELLFVLRGVDTEELFGEAVESGILAKVRGTVGDEGRTGPATGRPRGRPRKTPAGTEAEKEAGAASAVAPGPAPEAGRAAIEECDLSEIFGVEIERAGARNASKKGAGAKRVAGDKPGVRKTGKARAGVRKGKAGKKKTPEARTKAAAIAGKPGRGTKRAAPKTGKTGRKRNPAKKKK